MSHQEVFTRNHSVLFERIIRPQDVECKFSLGFVRQILLHDGHVDAGIQPVAQQSGITVPRSVDVGFGTMWKFMPLTSRPGSTVTRAAADMRSVPG